MANQIKKELFLPSFLFALVFLVCKSSQGGQNLNILREKSGTTQTISSSRSSSFKRECPDTRDTEMINFRRHKLTSLDFSLQTRGKKFFCQAIKINSCTFCF